VRFAGEVHDHDLPSYYAACDIFLLPNRVEGGDFEGFGIVFLEAAATEKPSIGGRTGGVSEAIEGGVTGLLVSGEDIPELAEAIRRLAASVDLRRAMGQAARARVLGSFTWEIAAAKVAEIQRQLAKGIHGPDPGSSRSATPV
jgi:phosphatidylinositol alpha-1,6-mannosyltransferase